MKHALVLEQLIQAVLRSLIVLCAFIADSSSFAADRCIANIQENLESLGDAARQEFNLQIARTIVRDFDFGNVAALTADPAKRVAFRQVFESLSEFIDLSAGSLTANGMRGYTRFAGAFIRSGDAQVNGYLDAIKRAFGGETQFDGQGFSDIMEELITTGGWLNQTQWKSPAGLIYSRYSDEGHRITHVLGHSSADFDSPPFSVFSVSRAEVLSLIDEAWSNPSKYNPPIPGTSPPKVNPSVWICDMGRDVGTAGERKVRIQVHGTGSNEIVTAYPIE